jgi:hypothetical protein
MTQCRQLSRSNGDPHKAAASEEARRTLRYVEPLSDARTPEEPRFNVIEIKNPQGLRQTLRIAPATSSSPVPQPSRERWSWEPTRRSPFCCGERSQTICRVPGMKRSSTYCREYASGRYHACGLASDPISFASQRRDPPAGSRSGQVFWLMVHPTSRAFPA